MVRFLILKHMPTNFAFQGLLPPAQSYVACAFGFFSPQISFCRSILAKSLLLGLYRRRPLNSQHVGLVTQSHPNYLTGWL